MVVTWKDILKVMAPNLQSVNMMTALRHDAEDKPDTMTGAGKPESDDSRCRDRLQQFINDLDALVKNEPDWHLDTHAGGLTLTEEAFPEEICCEILENLASSVDAPDGSSNVRFFYRKTQEGYPPWKESLNEYGYGGRVIHMWILNDEYRDDIQMDWSRCALFYGGHEAGPLGGPESFLVELEQLVDGEKITSENLDRLEHGKKQRYENWVKLHKKIMGILP